MRKLSTGADATLGNVRALCVAFFGEDSAATAWLDAQISEQGVDQPVIADEYLVVYALAEIDLEGEDRQT